MTKTALTPMHITGLWGWKYDGQPIPDDVRLAFAKTMHLIEHFADDDGDTHVTVIDKRGEQRFYAPGDYIVLTRTDEYAKLITENHYFAPAADKE